MDDNTLDADATSAKRRMIMAKQHLSRDEKLLMKGRLEGIQQTMDLCAMVLLDKFGWHINEETPDNRDTESLRYFYDCVVETTKEINEGRIKRRHIKEMLADEYKVIFE